MKTVHEVSKITGVSVRTLHHYDAIGLLKPTAVTDVGYRLYDDMALSRLQTILLFRELQFSLKDIKNIIDNESFDKNKALKQQLALLELQRNYIDNLIFFVRKIIKTGVNTMDFSAFDKTEIEEYRDEAKKQWGETDAYKEFENKTEGQSYEHQNIISNELMKIFTEIGKIKQLSENSKEAQKLVEKLQSFITENYYQCTDEILSGLGDMYVCDSRMAENIDKVGGKGTAEFANKAIKAYLN